MRITPELVRANSEKRIEYLPHYVRGRSFASMQRRFDTDESGQKEMGAVSTVRRAFASWGPGRKSTRRDPYSKLQGKQVYLKMTSIHLTRMEIRTCDDAVSREHMSLVRYFPVMRAVVVVRSKSDVVREFKGHVFCGMSRSDRM